MEKQRKELDVKGAKKIKDLSKIIGGAECCPACGLNGTDPVGVMNQ